MRIAELSRRAGLSVPTVKYYLREGLLPPGRRTSVNQAVYGDLHLHRLRLIRALAKIAGLPLSKIREVVDAVNSESSALEAMAATQDALVGDIEIEPVEPATIAVLEKVIESRGWLCQPSSPAYTAAIKAIAELRAEKLTLLFERLDDYAQAADLVGRIDVETVQDAENLDTMISAVVLGSALRRPLLDALTLLAQQHYAQVNNQAIETKPD